MNDKCAAGTGRFLEMMARTLGVDISELGPLAMRSKRPLTLSSICTIFAEIEVMQLLYSKKKPKHIAAGVHAALARRIKSLVGRVGLAKEACMTGGVSKNSGMVYLLERELGLKFIPLSIDAQLVGALGAALFALEAWRTGKVKEK
jgi:predicted CoA-substrate-specific enzyme activase